MAQRRKRRKPKTSKALLIVFFSLIVLIISGLAYLKYMSPSPGAGKGIPYAGDNSFSSYVAHFSKYSVFGIDVSEYQKKIDWKKVASEEKLEFVFIRSTAGNNRVDKEFAINWEQAGKHDIVRGAYHYYRPDENSVSQAQNFIKTVSLKQGDLPPVLDIEAYSRVQNTNSLKKGLLNWLDLVEKHYSVTPIIYTYPNMYKQLFEGDERFNKYQVWISYLRISGDAADIAPGWLFWQFSHTGRVNGIHGNVDINIFRGNTNNLQEIVVK